MIGPQSRESGFGPTPEPPNPLNSLPAFTALNLHNVIKAAPPLQYHPDLAHAAATAGGDVGQNAQSIMGAHIFHNFVNTALSSVGNDFHWHLNNATNQYNDTRPATPAVTSPLVQPPPGHKYEMLPNGDVKITSADPNAVRYVINATGDAIPQNAGDMVIPAGSPALNYQTGIAGSDITAEQAKMLRAASLAQRNAGKQTKGLEGISDKLGAAGMPQAEVRGETFEQTLISKLADATGQRSEVSRLNLPPGPTYATSPLEDFAGWLTQTAKQIVNISTQQAPATSGHTDIIRHMIDMMFNQEFGKVGSDSHTRLEEAARVMTDSSVKGLIHAFIGAGKGGAEEAQKQLVNSQTELSPGHYDAYPGTSWSSVGLAVVQGATGASNPIDFLKNTQDQFKYLYWIYKNKGPTELYEAVAPIVIGAIAGGASGAALRTGAASAELTAIRAGATEAEAASAARAAAGGVTKEGGPIKAPPRTETKTPTESSSKIPGENTYPDYAPKAKAGEVKKEFVTSAEMTGETSGITLSPSVASSVKEVINQALNDVWNIVDKGHWAGLKSKPLIDHDIHSMSGYGETALNNRLAELRSANPDMTNAEFDIAHRAAHRIMANKVNEFHDLGKANFEAGRTYRGASWVGQAAVKGAKGIKAAIKPVDWLSRNDAWAGAQMSSFVISKQMHPDWWEAAQKADMRSIGQMVFDGTPLSGVTSGIADAFVALTSGPVPVGHLFARGGVAGEATNITAEEVDRAWTQGFGAGTFRNALRTMEGRTPGEVVQMFRELAVPADSEGNSIASKLARADENGKMVMGTAEETYKRFRALTVGESYASLAKLPTTSVYGWLRAGKVDGGKFINWMSRTFGRMPFTIDEQGHLVNRAIHYGDPQAPNLVADLLRNVGYDHNEVNAIVDKMLANPSDTQLMKDTFSGAIKDVMANSVAHNLNQMLGGVFHVENLLKALKEDRKWLKNFEKGKVDLTPQQEQDLRRWIAEKEAIVGPHEPMLKELYKEIDNAAKELVGSPAPTQVGAYAKKHTGGVRSAQDISQIEGGRLGGLSLQQTGVLYIPSYKDINKAMYEIVHWSTKDGQPQNLANAMSAGNTAAYWMMKSVPMGADFINRVFNNAFFKPLALLTGGWATRVSMSELAINTPRHGLRDMGAGFASQNLIKQQRIAYDRIGQKVWMETSPEMVSRKITAKYGPTQAVQGVKNSAMDSAVAREISLVVRGMMSGLDQTILAGLGKAEFADAAIELMWKHDGYLPGSVGAVHNSPYRQVEMSQYDRQIRERKRGKKAVAPRTKMVSSTGQFTTSSYGGQGYFSGWQNMARFISEDDVLYRPIANIYRDLYDTGLRGEKLRLAAINQAESYLRSQPENVLSRIERSTKTHVGTSYPDDPIKSWAEAKIDNLEYTVHGWEGKIGSEKNGAYFHDQLLNDIADGNIPHDLNTFIRKYATNDKGSMLPHKKMPYETISPEVDIWRMGDGGGFINALASRGHQKVLGPLVNHLVRNPLYIVNYVNASKKIAPLVERGLLTADQASVMAEIRATRDMLPTIHNPLDKTKFEEMLTTGFPFYFAQNQAWRRVGRLFASDPGAFMQYYIAMSAVAQTVQDITKNSGLGVIAVPLTLALLGVPLTASFTSMAVIDPFSTSSDTQGPSSPVTQATEMFAPHAGWVATVLGHIVLLDAPGIFTDNKSVKSDLRNIAQNQMVVGPIGSSENLIDAAIPNSILKTLKQFAVAGASSTGGSSEDIAPTGAFSAPAWTQAYLEARSSLMYEEMKKKLESLKNSGLSNAEKRIEVANYISKKFNPNVGGNDYNWLVNQSRNAAFITLTGKLLLGSFSPLSIGIGDTNPQVRALRDKLSSDPVLGFNGAIAKIYQEEPYFTAEMMFKTKAEYGNSIPESQPVYQFLKDQGPFIQDNPLAAWAFGPDVTKNSNYFQPALQAMLDAGMRKRQTPRAVLETFFNQLGWNTYYNDIIPYAKKHAADLAKAGIKKSDGKPFTESGIRTELEATLQKDNPSWYFKTGAKAAAGERAVEQLQSLMYDTKYKDLQNSHRPLIKHLQEFFDSPEGYAMHNQLRGEVTKRQITSEDARATWVDGIIPDWVKKYPDLAPAMHTIFANLG